jgi:YesN/AraC family two-component response regulator
MRRTQPAAATFILTGYPGFDSALEAIRQQVDGYLVKPTDIASLVETIQARLAKLPIERLPLKRLADVLEENRDAIVRDWVAKVKEDPELSGIHISDRERQDHVPRLLDEGLNRARGAKLTLKDSHAAMLHGITRRKQGYSIPLLIRETKILQAVIGECTQQNLLAVQVSNLRPDIARITETIHTELEASGRAFIGGKENPTAAKSQKRNKKLKRGRRAD